MYFLCLSWNHRAFIDGRLQELCPLDAYTEKKTNLGNAE